MNRENYNFLYGTLNVNLERIRHMENKIVKCEIKKGRLWEEDTVHATFEDGTTKKLFGYFSDELSFSESEFIGLTERQALDLRHKRDVAYLQN